MHTISISSWDSNKYTNILELCQVLHVYLLIHIINHSNLYPLMFMTVRMMC